MVILSHGGIWPRIKVTNQAFLSIFSAHNGVDIFFAISGFLITIFLIKEKEETGKIRIGKFLIRRALRIFPIYYLVIILLFIIDYMGMAKIKTCTFLYLLTFVQNYAPAECSFSSMSHFWALAVEQHFYMVWPFIFLLGKRVALSFAVVFAIICFLLAPNIYSAFPSYEVWRWTIPAATSIAFGCISAFVYNSSLIKALFANDNHSPIILVAILAGLASPGFTQSYLLWLVSLASLIIYVYHNQNSFLVKFLELKPLALLGIISYGLYVWQGFFSGNGSYRIGEQFPPDVDLGMTLAFITAPLSYILLEKPLLKLKDRFSWNEQIPLKKTGESGGRRHPVAY